MSRRSVTQKNQFEEVGEEYTEVIDLVPVPVKSDSRAVPFVWNKDHMRFRRMTEGCSPPNETHYILFILDTSGSIGTINFKRMTSGIGNISQHFCKPTQVAVMTFSHELHLEFCFNCHDNTRDGRNQLGQNIKNIRYRGGSTYTGAAAKCACSQLLHESCGFPATTDSIDIVFITDGYSNDRKHRICDEVKCLHGKSRNTFAIGIGDNVNESELNCMVNTTVDNDPNIFSFKNFTEFENALNVAVFILNNPMGSANYTCANDGGCPTNKKK